MELFKRRKIETPDPSVGPSAAEPPTRVSEFVQAVTGRVDSAARNTRVRRFVPAICPERVLQDDPAERARIREFVSQICPERAAELDAVDRAAIAEAEWDPAKHPRGGYPENRGWFSPSGHTGRSTATFPSDVVDRLAALSSSEDDPRGAPPPQPAPADSEHDRSQPKSGAQPAPPLPFASPHHYDGSLSGATVSKQGPVSVKPDPKWGDASIQLQPIKVDAGEFSVRVSSQYLPQAPTGFGNTSEVTRGKIRVTFGSRPEKSVSVVKLAVVVNDQDMLDKTQKTMLADAKLTTERMPGQDGQPDQGGWHVPVDFPMPSELQSPFPGDYWGRGGYQMQPQAINGIDGREAIWQQEVSRTTERHGMLGLGTPLSGPWHETILLGAYCADKPGSHALAGKWLGFIAFDVRFTPYTTAAGEVNYSITVSAREPSPYGYDQFNDAWKRYEAFRRRN